MVLTRSQVRREQTSRLIAPLGVNSPQGSKKALQAGGEERGEGSSSVDVPALSKAPGDRPSSGARATYFEYRRGGEGRAFTQNRNDDMKPKKCGHRQCKTCDIFNEDDKIISASTGKSEKIRNDRNCDINCKTENVVYILECNRCKIQ